MTAAELKRQFRILEQFTLAEGKAREKFLQKYPQKLLAKRQQIKNMLHSIERLREMNYGADWHIGELRDFLKDEAELRAKIKNNPQWRDKKLKEVRVAQAALQVIEGAWKAANPEMLPQAMSLGF